MIGLSDANATQIKPLVKTYTFAGKELTFETGKLALLANGSVTISDSDDNILLVTTGVKEVGLNKQASFFPLVVDFQEKYYATWNIGGGRFMKREARPSENATLTARMIDRPIRPMFPKGIVNDTQIIATVLSSAWEKELGTWGITGASIWLLMAGTIFDGPVSSVKIAMNDDGSFIYDPSLKEEETAILTLITAWTLDALTMVEAEWKEATNEQMLAALEYSHWLIKQMCEAQNDFLSDYEKQFGITKIQPTFNLPDMELYSEVQEFLTLEKLDCLYNKWKKEFQAELDKLDIEVIELLKLTDDDDSSFVGDMVYKRVKEVMRENILKSEKRLDWRKIDEVRSIKWETGLLPRTHGSALFQRGMTQALSIVTLWWPDDEQLLDGMMPESTKRYMHHYNFPPYSVGEVRMMRGVGRREVGHGRLWEKALEAVLPSEEEFPYVVRVVSEITTCNGSSSMASVCGSTMSLMNAWVPIKTPVAWVAMWMIYDENTWEYKILSDIQAQEDFLWDMDFKVARTKNGITAMQLDVKVKGLSMKVFEEAFAQGEQASMHIMWEMLKTQPSVATELSQYAPLIMTINIPVDKIRGVIWKGWENVQRMEKDYEVKISIADDGVTTITATNQVWGKKVITEIEQMIWEPEVGYKSTGKIVKIIDGVWAIVEFRWKSWMIHISKLAAERVTKVEDIVKEWEDVEFEVIQVDVAKGRIGLKRKF